AAGFTAWGGVRRAFIGAGMVPRGEVGLIFASLGKATGALPERVFVAVVLAVFATTFLAPPLLKACCLGVVGSANEKPRIS
ncbi:MAG TPA: cation:proton antiporter, partial [Thermoanaerobaculia bacterium]|nr:cation:proton antiporter [Thermoanaerobaculia bacterium]